MAKMSDKVGSAMKNKVSSLNNTTERKVHSFDKKNEVYETLESISVKLIIEKENIRETYSENELMELGNSMLEVGQLEPCVVSLTKDDMYELQIGHRRFRAAKLCNIAKLNCIVRKPFENNTERLIKQMIENEQREDLTPEEREEGIYKLIQSGLTKTDISKKLGKSLGWVSQIVSAYEVRSGSVGKKLKKAGIDLTTDDAYKLRNAEEEEIDEIIDNLSGESISASDKKQKIKKLVSEKKKDPRGRKKTDVDKGYVDIESQEESGNENNQESETSSDDYIEKDPFLEEDISEDEDEEKEKYDISIQYEKNNAIITITAPNGKEDLLRSLIENNIMAYINSKLPKA